MKYMYNVLSCEFLFKVSNMKDEHQSFLQKWESITIWCRCQSVSTKDNLSFVCVWHGGVYYVHTCPPCLWQPSNAPSWTTTPSPESVSPPLLHQTGPVAHSLHFAPEAGLPHWGPPQGAESAPSRAPSPLAVIDSRKGALISLQNYSINQANK